MKKISILGSTGSIGLSTLEIVRKHPDRFKVVGLAGGSRVEELAKQASEFKPLVVSVKAEGDIQKLRGFPGMEKIEILSGTSGAAAVASLREADLVISAIVGAAGLLPT
ncbi:MAG: 1-deoxy-D-xylulose-5-phosphate reductoisomerase, partial [Deltaproteobacteria bacterium]|nr:1-deoxy-D-xylulose-5-phosphate reductoisomerase [Deltaproteobacteria bacterium]